MGCSSCAGCGGTCGDDKPAMESASQPVKVLSWAILTADAKGPQDPFWNRQLVQTMYDRFADPTDPRRDVARFLIRGLF